MDITEDISAQAVQLIPTIGSSNQQQRYGDHDFEWKTFRMPARYTEHQAANRNVVAQFLGK